MSRFSGVGRFSVLAQGTLDEYTTDTNVGVKKSVGSRGKQNYNHLCKYFGHLYICFRFTSNI